MALQTRHRAETGPPRRYESLKDAASRTGLGVRTLRRRIADGSLPAYRLGGPASSERTPRTSTACYVQSADFTVASLAAHE